MYPNLQNIQITEKEPENEDFIRQQKLKRAKYLLSTILALVGLVILASQLGPLTISYINGKILENQITTLKDPAPSNKLSPRDQDLPYYDPGLSYFQNVMMHIGGSANQLQNNDPNTKQATIDREYNSPMQITISSVGINRINITPNVDSFNENTYNSALKNGLAHFQGTPLPGDGGNSFIYGHSALQTVFSKKQDDPEIIFSRLENIEIADEIIVHKDGKDFRYSVQRKKITNPEDFGVVSGIKGKETVTLMTCWPLGIGSQRLIVIGELIDGR